MGDDVTDDRKARLGQGQSDVISIERGHRVVAEKQNTAGLVNRGDALPRAVAQTAADGYVVARGGTGEGKRGQIWGRSNVS